VVDDASFQSEPFQGLSRGPLLGFWPDLNPDDTALISYVNSSGAPKGVVLSHENVICNCMQLQHPFRINGSDRFLCVLPLSSVAAEILLLLAPWAAGAACILRDAGAPSLLQDLVQSRATVFAGAAQLYSRMAESPDFEHCELSCLRLAICTSGPVGEPLLKLFEDCHDILIVEGYGRVEAGALSCANPYTGVRKAGSLGMPLPGQDCRIADERGRELPAGNTGEIVIRGGNVMKGYYRDPESSAAALRNGWLHTGDRARADHDGYYYLAE
jgi:long-subunit acyl-CoA synthetase (AMP-forming)